MPKISQQAAAPAPPRPQLNGSIASRITALQSTKLGKLKVSLYGNPKTGKTRLAVSFPKPLLLIGAEDGTASVVGTKGVDFVRLERTEELAELTAAVLRGGKYASVALDTATKLREMRVIELFASMGMVGDKMPERKPFLYADKVWKDVWVQTSQDIRGMLSILLDLPRVQDTNVIIIAQEQNLYAETTTSDLIKPVVSSALGKSVADWLNAECDYIGQTLIRDQVEMQAVPGMKDAKPIPVKTGRKEYCLRIAPDSIYQAGFRLPEGRKLTEEFIVDPSYAKIKAVIDGAAGSPIKPK